MLTPAFYDETSRVSPDTAAPTYWLLGLPLDGLTMEQAKARIMEAARNRTPLTFATPNVNFLAQSARNPEFHDTLLRTQMSLLDSMPLTWLARLLGVPVPERVAGSTLVESFLADKGARPLKVYFFGGQPGVAEAACRAVNEAGGGLRAVGAYDPGFVSVERMSEPEIIRAINASGADMLVLALGAEKGHCWIDRNRDRITVPVISHLGAAVNFLAGTVKRAPPIMQRLGLEWLWRIWQEPALARRYWRDALYLAGETVRAVVPLLILRFRARPDAELTVTASRREGQLRLSLRGQLTSDTLDILKAELARLPAGAGNVDIELDGLSTIDAEAIGYLYAIQYRPAHLTAAQITLRCSDSTLLERHRACALLRGRTRAGMNEEAAEPVASSAMP